MTTVQKISPPALGAGEAKQASQAVGGKSFQTVKAEIKPKDEYLEIKAMQHQLLNGKELSGKDLILYQIKAGQFGLRVELVSKVAEGVISTVRKFQNQQ